MMTMRTYVQQNESVSKTCIRGRIRPPKLGLNDSAAAAAAHVEFELPVDVELPVDSTEPKTALGMGTNPRSEEEQTNVDQETKEDEERMKELKPDVKPFNGFEEHVRVGSVGDSRVR